MHTEYIPYSADVYGNPLTAKVSWPDDDHAADPTKTTAARPIIMILHMGGYLVGSADVVPLPQIAYLTTTHNAVTVIPNYRLCPQVNARDGAFLDTAKCLGWIRHKLPSVLLSAHGVAVDTTRIAAVGHSAGGTLALYLAGTWPQYIRAVAAFYPSLYVSEPASSAHRPYAGFTAIPLPESAATDMSFLPADRQVSEAPLAPPGTKPAPRNLWQLALLKGGGFMKAVMPDGDYKSVDPCVLFEGSGPRWPPTMFVQGDKDDVPGSGIELVERAREELLGAGAKRVEVERVVGEGHVFDLPPMVGTSDLGLKWQAVVKGLDFVGQCVAA